MSDSKNKLGGLSLFSSSKASANPLSPTSSDAAQRSLNPLLGSSPVSPSAKPSLQVSDLLPLPDSSPSLDLAGQMSNQAVEMTAQPTVTFNEMTLETPDETSHLDALNQEPSRVLYLSAVGGDKVKVIKAIRAHWDLGLKDSKALADAAPLEMPPLPESRAEAAKAELSMLGATINAAGQAQVIHLVTVGARKVALIKSVRQHWDLGLKEAKLLVDAAPVDMPPLSPSATEAAQQMLAELGASFQVK